MPRRDSGPEKPPRKEPHEEIIEVIDERFDQVMKRLDELERKIPGTK